jgi:CheY-like chemotaxis protein
MSLLIVDDGILHHAVVGQACKKLQLSFEGAETEEAALAFYQKGRRFDIVLMDIHLGPKVLGYDVARKILELDPKALIISFSSDPIAIRM